LNFLERILDFLIYFFRSKPEGYDIEKYGFTHIVLVIIAFAGAIIIYKYRDKFKNSNKNILKVFVAILFLQQFILYFWYITSGAFSIETSLPLYDCRVAIICLIYGVFFHNEKSKRIGIYLGFVGSIVALLTPELDKFAFPHYTWISFFVGHTLLLWVSCYIFFVEKIEIYPITYIAIMMLILNFGLYLVHSYFMKSRDREFKISHREIEN